MKLKKLTIHNLASIEDALIDFEHGPLSEDSRFLICGPTGSGKTTLLDAICLVLYGTTPRLNVAKSEGFVDNDEKYGGKQDVKIDDTRMLMRRGSLNAYVELVFTDKDDKLLKASWECSRAHNKITGSIKDPVWKLSDASDNEISCKKKEIRNYIEQSIGLTFEQFCRTTMLAQGDFTRFLKSEEGEKSQILEKLTGTDIYSEISRQIHIIKSEKETICSQIKSRLDGVQLLTEEERNEILQKLQTLNAKAAELSAEEQKLTAIKSWMEQVRHQEQQYAQVSKDYDEQHKLIETEEFVRNSKLVNDWQRTASQREEWNKRANAEKLIAQHREKETELKNTYVYLSSGLLSLQNEEKRGIEKRKEIETFIKAEESNADSYSQINLIQSLVQQHKQTSLQIRKSDESIIAKNKEIESLKLSHKQQIEIVRKSAADVETQSKELNIITHELQQMNYNGLLSQQNANIKESDSLKEYLALVELYAQCHDTLLQKEKELNDIRKDIAVCKEAVDKAEKEEKNLGEQVAMQQKIYDKQEKSCKDIIKLYRSQLKEGDTCPLCGQKITEIVSDEHFISVLQPVKECLEQLKDKHSEAGKQLSDKKAVLIQAVNTEKIRLDEYSRAEVKDRDVKTRKQMHAMHAEYKSYDNPTDEINKKKNTIDECLKNIDAQLKTVGEKQEKVAEMQKKKEHLETKLHDEENKLKDIENKCSLASNYVVSEKEKKESLTQTLTETEEKMSHYISLESYAKDGDAYILSLKNAAEKYQKATERLQNADKYLQQIASDIKHICELKLMIEDKHEEWKTFEITDSMTIRDLSSCWMKLQADVMSNSEAFKQTEKVYCDADTLLQNYFKEENAVEASVLSTLALRPSSEIEGVRNNLQEIRDRELSTKAKKTTIEHNLQTLRADRPEFAEDITYEMILADLQTKKSEINELNQQLGQNKQILENDEAYNKRYAEIKEQLAKADKELEQWSELHELFGSADGKKFRNIAQSYVLEQLLVNANQYLHQFTDRYEMLCQPGSLTILLRDNDAGGTMRPTTTMSGGESFLLSLSLALGLSSLSRASFSVDTLFIDEGFGTLDSTYLSCVMDALERLHQMGGKRIGIISHVESLKERLTTQIQVSRVNSTLSKVEVVSTI